MKLIEKFKDFCREDMQIEKAKWELLKKHWPLMIFMAPIVILLSLFEIVCFFGGFDIVYEYVYHKVRKK